jgi:hypothetical protein
LLEDRSRKFKRLDEFDVDELMAYIKDVKAEPLLDERQFRTFSEVEEYVFRVVN